MQAICLTERRFRSAALLRHGRLFLLLSSFDTPSLSKLSGKGHRGAYRYGPSGKTSSGQTIDAGHGFHLTVTSSTHRGAVLLGAAFVGIPGLLIEDREDVENGIQDRPDALDDPPEAATRLAEQPEALTWSGPRGISSLAARHDLMVPVRATPGPALGNDPPRAPKLRRTGRLPATGHTTALPSLLPHSARPGCRPPAGVDFPLSCRTPA